VSRLTLAILVVALAAAACGGIAIFADSESTDASTANVSIKGVLDYVWVTAPTTIYAKTFEIHISSAITNATMFRFIVENASLHPTVFIYVEGGEITSSSGVDVESSHEAMYGVAPGGSGYVTIEARQPLVTITIGVDLSFWKALGNYSRLYINGVPRPRGYGGIIVVVKPLQRNLVAECAEAPPRSILVLPSYASTFCTVEGVYVSRGRTTLVKLLPTETVNGVAVYTPRSCPHGVVLNCSGTVIRLPSLTYALSATVATANTTLAIIMSSPLKVESASYTVIEKGSGQTKTLHGSMNGVAALLRLDPWTRRAYIEIDAIASTKGTLLLRKAFSSVRLSWSGRADMQKPRLPAQQIENIASLAFIVGTAFMLIASVFRGLQSVMGGGLKALKELVLDVAAPVAAWLVLALFWKTIVTQGIDAALNLLALSESVEAAIHLVLGTAFNLVAVAIAAATWGAVAIFVAGVATFVALSSLGLAPIGLGAAEVAGLAISNLASYLTTLGNELSGSIGGRMGSMISGMILPSVSTAIVLITILVFPIVSAVLIAIAPIRELTRKAIAASIGFGIAPLMMRIIAVPLASIVMGSPSTVLGTAYSLALEEASIGGAGVVASVVGGLVSPTAAASTVAKSIEALWFSALSIVYSSYMLVVGEILAIGTAFAVAALIYASAPAWGSTIVAGISKVLSWFAERI